MSSLQALLFDLDGTLANTDPLHFRAWRDMLARHGFEIDEAGYRSRISGRLNPDIVADLLPGLTADEGRALIDGKEARFRTLATELEPLPGLTELLVWAESQELELALVTNAPRENAQFMLEALDLFDRFPVMVVAEEAPAGKPDPAPYRLALERLAVPAAAALAFEDSPSGVRSAVAAGLKVVAIDSTHDPKMLAEVGAALVVNDFTDSRLERLLH